MSSSPRRTLSGSQSPRDRRAPSLSGTLSRSRSSQVGLRNTSLGVDEGSALSDLHRKADKQLEDERRREAEAKMYWEEKKKQEQQKFSDEDSDSETTVNAYSKSKYNLDDGTVHNLHSSRWKSNRPSSAMGSVDKFDRDNVDSGVSNGLEATRALQEKYQDVEGKYKESMVANAQLYNEKTALIYQVEGLKDRLEDYVQEMAELRGELQREQSQVLHMRHTDDVQLSEIDSLKKQIKFRDEFLERHGLHLPTGEEDEEEQAAQLKGRDLSVEEREELLKQITSLKEEIASMKSSSLLGEHQPKDIVQVSTRMVSEYKTKLQIAEAENTRLEGMVSRLKGQVTRYKNQVKELEEREDELMKEKRHQGKEIRSLQSECEDYKTEVDLLKRRIEQLRKRRDYTIDS